VILKGQYIENLIFRNLERIKFAYMENTQNAEKSIAKNISLIIKKLLTFFLSSLSTLDRFDEARKPSHATVPLRRK
jgi:hypothetical protein